MRRLLLFTVLALLAAGAGLVAAQPGEKRSRPRGRQAGDRRHGQGRRPLPRGFEADPAEAEQPLAAHPRHQVGQGPRDVSGRRLLGAGRLQAKRKRVRIRVPGRKSRKLRYPIRMRARAVDACQGKRFPAPLPGPGAAMRRMFRIAALACAALVLATPAEASWNGSGNGGQAHSKARWLGAMAAPTVSATGRSVSVSWSAPSDGAPPTGYIVKRYDGSNQSQTVGSACAGTVNGTSCTESAVPAGTWTYKVTPARANWRGAESPGSSVTVAPPSLTLTPATVTSFPSALSGQLDGFVPGQTIAYRLDNPSSGTILSGSTTPSTIPANGHAGVSVTIPAGTANGAHTVYAIGSGSDQAQMPITVNAPRVSTSVIAKSNGGRDGKIKQGGTYHVYANVTGSRQPSRGTRVADRRREHVHHRPDRRRDDVRQLHGRRPSYNYRSAQLTANASLSAGSKAYSVTLTDAGGTQTTSSFSVTVTTRSRPQSTCRRRTSPAAPTASRRLGDTVTLTYSEEIEPISILSGWSGVATNVVVRVNDGVSTPSRSGMPPTARCSRSALTSTPSTTRRERTFGPSGTPSTMSRAARRSRSRSAPRVAAP